MAIWGSSTRLNTRTHAALVAIMECIVPSMFRAQQPWALVGSCASVLQGLPDYEPPDIDLATTAEGAYLMQDCITGYGTAVRPVKFSESGPYASHFGIFEVQGVKIEVMGDLVIRCEDGVIDLNDHFARWSDEVRICDVDGLHIPMIPLEWQLVANALLGRADRVEALAGYLCDQGYDRPFLETILADETLGQRTLGWVRRVMSLDS
jgi:hypothetical protein